MTGVMGFLAQCAVCPQRALLTDQLDSWICPRCIEVADVAVNDVELPYKASATSGEIAAVDDEFELGWVRG